MQVYSTEGRIDLGLFEQRLDGDGREFARLEGGETAADGADGGSDRTDDEDFPGHEDLPVWASDYGRDSRSGMMNYEL